MTRTGARLERIQSLSLILTADCNLRCTYCYQNAKSDARMSRDTARSAVDLLFRSRRAAVELLFSGGEPLLAWPLLRRTVDYAKDTCPSRTRLGFGLTTNGLLITDEVAAFLAENRFDLQISFDGIPEAQNVRGPNTFPVLDRLLDRLRRAHPAFYRRHLTVCITLTPGTLGALARSVEYLLDRRAAKISITPSISDAGRWVPEDRDRLDREMAAVVDAGRSHVRRTGDVPVLLLRRSRTSPPGAEDGPGPSACDLVRGEHPVVDVDGTIVGCDALAGSYQRFATERLRVLSDAARVGTLEDPDLEARFRDARERIRGTGFFDRRETRYSSYGRCAECRWVNRCALCPAVLAHSRSSDPDRVPDFHCAFQRAALEANAGFPARPHAIFG